MLFKLVFFLWFLALNFGQFSALSKSTFGGIYLFDILAVVWVFIGLSYLLIKKKSSLFIPKDYFFLFAFIFIAFVSLVFSFSRFSFVEMAHSSFYLFRFVIYLAGGILFYNFIREEIFSMDFLYLLVGFSVVFVSLAGLIQLVVLPDFTVLDSSLGWDPHKNRLASTFFDPNFVGAYLVLCFSVLLAGMKYFGKFFVPLVLISLLSILLTFSRSAWLMLAISVFIWGLLKYRFLLFLGFFLAFSAYFAVPRIQTRISGVTDPSDSAHFRLISWKNTWEIASDNLLLGTGFNTFRFVQKDFGFLGVDWGGHAGGGSDSSLLLVLATTGVLGLVVFIGFFASLFFKSLASVSSGWSVAFLASITGLMAESFFINSLFYPQILFMWGLIVVGFLITFSCKKP